MSKLDHTLKILADRFAPDYAKWLFGPSVRLIEKIDTELPTITRYADFIYRVMDEENQIFIFHLEFQGQRSKDPMNLRMLGYNVRLFEKHRIPVCSTVIYLIESADAGDEGYFRSTCPIGAEDLNSRYKVVRLWELDGLSMLRARILGLYPLLGLFRSLRSLHQPCKQGRRFAIRKEDIMESPMLKEIYEEAMQEGIIKGEKKGKQEGIEEGLALGRLEAIRNNIIEFLLARFEVPYKTGKQIEDIIKSIDSISVLQKLIGDLARSGTLEDFVKVLDKLEVGALK